MEHTVEEEERIKAIQRHLEGERPVDIYRRKRLMTVRRIPPNIPVLVLRQSNFTIEELGYKPSEIPSLSTIKRIIKRNQLRMKQTGTLQKSLLQGPLYHSQAGIH
jgi:hypothetical protein